MKLKMTMWPPWAILGAESRRLVGPPFHVERQRVSERQSRNKNLATSQRFMRSYLVPNPHRTGRNPTREPESELFSCGFGNSGVAYTSEGREPDRDRPRPPAANAYTSRTFEIHSSYHPAGHSSFPMTCRRTPMPWRSNPRAWRRTRKSACIPGRNRQRTSPWPCAISRPS